MAEPKWKQGKAEANQAKWQQGKEAPATNPHAENNVRNFFNNAVGQGLMFGWGDEIAGFGAAARAKLLHGNKAKFGDIYDKAVARERAEIEAYKKANPGMAMTSEIVGGLIPTIATGGAGLLARGATAGASKLAATKAAPALVKQAAGNVAAKAAPSVVKQAAIPTAKKLAVQGAGYGAVGGLGNAEALEGVSGLEQAAHLGGSTLMGAGIGGALGFAAPKAISAINAGGRNLYRRFTPGSSGAVEAEEMMIKKMRDAGMTPTQVSEKLKQLRGMGTEATILDTTPQFADVAEAVANMPGKGRERLVGVLNERVANARSRIAAKTHEELGGGVNFALKEEQLLDNLRKGAAPFYEKAYKAGPIDNKTIDQLLTSPHFRQAYKEAEAIAANEKLLKQINGESLEGTVMQPLYKMVNGELVRDTTKVPDVRTLDYMKRGLDAMIEKGFSGGGMSSAEAQSIKALKNKMLGTLDDLVPDYKLARSKYAGDAEAKDALAFGRDQVFKDKLSPDQLKLQFDKMSDMEKELVRVGAAENLSAQVGNKARQVNAANEIFGAPRDRQKIETLFDTPQNFNKFSDAMIEEGKQFSTAQRIYQGSPTARRLELQNELKQANALEDAFGGSMDAATGNVPGLVSRGIKYFGGGPSKLSEIKTDKLADMLTIKDAGMADELAKRLESRAKTLGQRELSQATREGATVPALVAPSVSRSPLGYATEESEEVPTYAQGGLVYPKFDDGGLVTPESLVGNFDETSAPLSKIVKDYAQGLGQKIIEGHEKNRQLQAQAFSNPERPFKVTDKNALSELGNRYFEGVSGFAPAGIFIGKSSSLWNKMMQKEAEKLEKQGIGAEEIWKKTGTGRGVGNAWRQEIDDSDMILKKNIPEGWNSLNDVVQHPTLFKAYPDLSRSEIMYSKTLPKDVSGGARPMPGSPERTYFEVNRADKLPDKTSTMVHELQHHIQRQEGFPQGGNLHTAKPIAQKLFGKNATPQQIDSTYRRLGGEVEAEVSRARHFLSEKQRRENFPFKKHPLGYRYEPDEIITTGYPGGLPIK